MKIAILHMTMGLVSRGSEVVIHELATALSQSHEVLVLQSGPVSEQKYQVQQIMPMTQAPSPAPENTWDKILFHLHLNQSARAVRHFTARCQASLATFAPDIIIAVNGADQVRLLRGFSSKFKIVVFGHAGIGVDDAANLAAAPDLFVALSPAAYAWAQKLASASTKVVHIPNPIDLAPYQDTKSYLHHLPHPVVLVVGALTAYKNIGIAVASAKPLSASLLLVGDGEQSEAIADLLGNYGADFRWLKSIESAKMPWVYRSADAFCFVPDSQESFGMVYLEAMAAGLPIVASDDPIRRELVGEQGFFADPHDVSLVSKALESALTHGPVSYTKELKSYSLPNVINQIEKELHDLTQS